MEESVSFDSGGLRLAGLVSIPSGLRPGERRSAVVILHGFGGHKDGPQQRWSSARLAEWGYVTLRFDFRGCGESEGRRGWVLPLEEVEDARSAVNSMLARPDVDPERIAVIGTSYGATVGVHAAGVERRIAAVIAQGGWANGARMIRALHATDAAWQRFTGMLERGPRHHAETGQSLMVHRYDIIPVPEHLRENIDRRSIFEFPVDTALATLEFNAEEMVGRIAPRPLLLLHSARDMVIAASNSIELFARADQPADLYVMSGVDHFMFGESDPRVNDLVRDWLARYLPPGR